MKKNFMKSKVAVATILSILAFSCSKIENTTYEELKDDLTAVEKESEEENVEEVIVSLTDLVSETEELSLLNDAIETAGLEPVMSGEGPLTVFAPTNQAVMGLFTLLGDEYQSFEDFDTLIELEILNRILTYHLVLGNLVSDNLVAGEVPTLYEGNSIEIVLSQDSFLIGDASEVDAKPIQKDRKATNGTLHVIDKILVPQDVIAFFGNPNPTNTAQKTIKELVMESDDFSFLKEALTITGLLDTLGEEGPFTVFAPSNQSLIGLLGLLGDGFSSLEDFTTQEDTDLLKEVLLYHVLGEELGSNNFNSGNLNTLSGDNVLQIIGEDGDYSLIDGLGLEANFKVTDIPAKNGVIHAIDRILIPESVIDSIENQVSLAFEQVMISTGDLNTSLDFFKKIQDRMNLEALAEKEFTFFFPSDQAFVDLFDQIGFDQARRFNEEEGLELLKIILSYHCVENIALKAADFKNEQSLATFQGEPLNVRLNQNDIFILDKTDAPSKVTLADQAILNGYIHIVDKILLPEEVLAELSL